jgi:hypothetical protein
LKQGWKRILFWHNKFHTLLNLTENIFLNRKTRFHIYSSKYLFILFETIEANFPNTRYIDQASRRDFNFLSYLKKKKSVSWSQVFSFSFLILKLIFLFFQPLFITYVSFNTYLVLWKPLYIITDNVVILVVWSY